MRGREGATIEGTGAGEGIAHGIVREGSHQPGSGVGLSPCRSISLPGLRLDKLKGDRSGQYSLRVNDQYRICFRWTEIGAEDVEIVDYH